MVTKSLAKLFITLGCLGMIGFSIVYLFLLKDVNASAGYVPFGVILVLSIAVYSSALRSLNNDDKKIALGVLLILFGGIIGGIFYLLWEPDKTGTVVEVNSNGAMPRSSDYVEYVSVSEESDDPYYQLKKLRELLDKGIIDKQTYDEKSKKYIKKL